MRELADRVLEQVRKVVVGQDDAVEIILVAAASSGHVLLEGVPGTAKTLLANAIARCFGLSFARVQFTPDMLPSDVTGTMTLRDGNLVFRPGPVFTNILLADEINRTPPKTQSALLEAMQEHKVSVEGQPHLLDDPFIVIATQNPIEYEGTYPLPEAQLDRFVVKIDIDYPSEGAEQQMLKLAHDGVMPATLVDVAQVANADDLIAARRDAAVTTIADEVGAYIVALVRQTRNLPSVSLGASPRAAIHLLAASKATARLSGRTFVTPDDVVRVAPFVLCHRLVLRPEAELERFGAYDAVRTAIDSVPVPK